MVKRRSLLLAALAACLPRPGADRGSVVACVALCRCGDPGVGRLGRAARRSRGFFRARGRPWSGDGPLPAGSRGPIDGQRGHRPRAALRVREDAHDARAPLDPLPSLDRSGMSADPVCSRCRRGGRWQAKVSPVPSSTRLVGLSWRTPHSPSRAARAASAPASPRRSPRSGAAGPGGGLRSGAAPWGSRRPPRAAGGPARPSGGGRGAAGRRRRAAPRGAPPSARRARRPRRARPRGGRARASRAASPPATGGPRGRPAPPRAPGAAPPGRSRPRSARRGRRRRRPRAPSRAWRRGSGTRTAPPAAVRRMPPGSRPAARRRRRPRRRARGSPVAAFTLRVGTPRPGPAAGRRAGSRLGRARHEGPPGAPAALERPGRETPVPVPRHARPRLADPGGRGAAVVARAAAEPRPGAPTCGGAGRVRHLGLRHLPRHRAPTSRGPSGPPSSAPSAAATESLGAVLGTGRRGPRRRGCGRRSRRGSRPGSARSATAGPPRPPAPGPKRGTFRTLTRPVGVGRVAAARRPAPASCAARSPVAAGASGPSRRLLRGSRPRRPGPACPPHRSRPGHERAVPPAGPAGPAVPDQLPSPPSRVAGAGTRRR